MSIPLTKEQFIEKWGAEDPTWDLIAGCGCSDCKTTLETMWYEAYTAGYATGCKDGFRQ